MASKYILRIIYNRFGKEVFSALDRLNPIRTSGFRKYKLSQHIDKAGKLEIIKFRDEAIELMKRFDDLDWYGFEKEYCRVYNLTFQKHFLDAED